MTERPDWKISDEELMKTSPAMALGRQIMSGEMSVEESVKMMQGMPGVEVKVDPGLVDPGPDPDFPERPDHPDFRHLSRIVQQMDYDGEHNEDHNVVEVLLPGEVDPESVLYLAKQRAHRAVELLSPDGTFYSKAVIMWLDAFTAGVKFGREQAVKAVLDEGIESGSHRFGSTR